MEINISKFDDLGNGLGKIDNKVYFVKYGIPNELLEIEILKENKNYNVANIKNIINKSNNRIEPICNKYYECGGCNFQHIKREEEIEFKRNKILNYFNKLDYFYKTSDYNYRNKISLHVINGILGYFKEKTNDLVKIDYCYLVKDKINEIIKLFNRNIDNKFNGNIIIRVNYNDESMVIINGIYKYLDLLKESDLINNLIYNNKIIKGNDYFIEDVNNYKFKVNYNSFFQVNLKGLKIIFKILDEFLYDKKINKALDLYSGISVLGINIAKYVKNVISVEYNKFATDDAKENIKLNNINNLEVINGLVSNHIDKFNNIDLVIVDPIRSGLDKKTIDYLKKIKSKYLIYIACGIDSLKRDLKSLKEIYDIDKIYGIDMFPLTSHCESICLLERKKN